MKSVLVSINVVPFLIKVSQPHRVESMIVGQNMLIKSGQAK